MGTVLGLFARFEDARQAVRILKESGVSDESLSILSGDEILGEVESFDLPAKRAFSRKESISNSAKELLGALAGLVIPDQKARIYSDGVKQGGAILIARATNRRANTVKMVMARLHAIEIHQIFPSIMSETTTESEELEPYVPLLWHQLNEV
jgi:hypothetical protein